MRYPALLAIAEIVAKELPKAEALYNEEQWRILEALTNLREKGLKGDEE